MARGTRFTACSLRRLCAGALSLLAPLAWLACAGAASPVTAGARLWIDGPVRWLMTPEELKQFRSLRTAEEMVEFVDAFWRRRDPTPEDDDNPFRRIFQERSQAADQLYAEAGRRGSLTDRGRALILLGPPSVLRYRQVPVPVLDPARHRSGGNARQRWMTQEVWVYRLEDLPASLLAMLPAEPEDGEIALLFAAEPRRTYLLEGEKLCQLAAQAAVAAAPP